MLLGEFLSDMGVGREFLDFPQFGTAETGLSGRPAGKTDRTRPGTTNRAQFTRYRRGAANAAEVPGGSFREHWP